MLSPLTGSLGPVWFPRRSLTYEQKLLAGLTGIVAYWPLTPDRWAEGAGGIVDVSGNGRHGTNNGATPDAVDGPSAAMGRAPSFDGINDFLNCSPVASSFNRNAYTIAFWAKRSLWNDGITRVAFVVKKDDNNITFVGKSSVGLWRYYHSPAVASLSASTTAWYHTALVFDGTTLMPYFNESALAPGTRSAWAGPAAHLYIGCNYEGVSTNQYIDGNIGHVLILDHAANEAERALINDPN